MYTALFVYKFIHLNLTQDLLIHLVVGGKDISDGFEGTRDFAHGRGQQVRPHSVEKPQKQHVQPIEELVFVDFCNNNETGVFSLSRFFSYNRFVQGRVWEGKRRSAGVSRRSALVAKQNKLFL